MIGLALEGGGARGAYEAGAYLALIECKIIPDMIAGTSIGALNGALMAQGDIDKLIDLWLNTTTDIFGIDSKIINKIKSKSFKVTDIKDVFNSIKNIIKNKGIDTTEYLNIIKSNIDEEKLRASIVKYGLITVKLTRGIKPVELTIDEIPKGKVAEYIMASCYLPAFKLVPIIDDNIYVDGGFYNNLPLSLLERNGCKTIYSVRISNISIRRNKLKKDTKIIEIKPRKSLGRTIIFDKEENQNRMRLGYYDALKVIKNLDGLDYYFKAKDDDYYLRIIRKVNKNTLKKLKNKFHTRSSKELFIRVIEKVLEANNVNKFRVLNIKKCLLKCKYSYNIEDKEIKRFIKESHII